MSFYRLVRPLVFAADAERAHGLTIAALKVAPLRRPVASDPILRCELAGLPLPNPIGLAAGFDKDAETPGPMLRLGFGFVEVGTVTPRPQPGNPRPRLFRLAEDRAVVNRMGFNNRGQQAAHARLAGRDRRAGIVGVNIGANKDAADRIADYATGARTMADVADYLTVNVSSPNTPGLRGLQEKSLLAALIDAVREATGDFGPPIFVKVAPDLAPAEIDDIAEIAVDRRLDALIVANTTVSRPPLRSRHAGEAGGLSGAPLGPLALQRLRDFRAATGGRVPLIAAGGIASGADAYARIRAGASLVQLYSALVYEGPGLVARMLADIAALLRRDGFASVAAAVGAT